MSTVIDVNIQSRTHTLPLRAHQTGSMPIDHVVIERESLLTLSLLLTESEWLTLSSVHPHIRERLQESLTEMFARLAQPDAPALSTEQAVALVERSLRKIVVDR